MQLLKRQQGHGASTLTDHKTAKLGRVEGKEILRVLESQLVSLDNAQAYIAAAHLDAAIQQLRIELARVEEKAATHSCDALSAAYPEFDAYG